MLVTETFHGYIETTQDVLLIFEGCRRGLLPRICRRLQERERKMIQSGSIFVFDERESGIKRWTDGRVWSPSRILGNFLIYRELDKKSNNEKKMSVSSTGSNNVMMLNDQNSNNTNEATRRSFSIDSSVSIDRNKERQLVGSLSDSYRFKEDGLIKKTMSIIVNGVAQHLISYYDPNEVLQEKLRAPSSVPELASLEISPELLVKQNFRIPPLVEPTFDQQGQLTPPEQQQQQQQQNSNNRMMHPLRSMSVGSIRGHHADLIQQSSSHLMYHASPYNNTTTATRPHSPNNFQHPLSIPNNVYNTNTNSQMPSPSSLSSSPSTPMLSPTRQSYQQQQHQRHYSTSSISSNSLPRFDPRNYSAAPTSNNTNNDTPFNTTNTNTTNSTNTTHDRQQQQLHTDGFGNNERFASPNLGQLLNPIHPLNNNNGNSNNDLLHSIGMSPHHHHHHGGYEYNNNANTAGSSSMRNSISSQHEDNTNTNTPTPTTSTTPIDQTNTTNANGNGSGGSGGGGGGGGGMSDYMNFYQRQPLANTHHMMNNNNNVMFSNDEQIAYMNGGPILGQNQNCMNSSDLEHLMLK